ncbi:hypothetical protein NHX12_008532 [Muraenolepis orangiensis]|uniref:Uncharacterized protein n=1 Tax=Muraenolepis orangiensis TaxID=630683 RepID=A0A9Q0DQ32_9TELE|nr:hypothetical protein NHX12_008532 [Muraenolepis orangiensis]
MLACLPAIGDPAIRLLSRTQMNTGIQKWETTKKMRSSNYPTPAQLDAYAKKIANDPLTIQIFPNSVKVPQRKHIRRTVNGLDTSWSAHQLSPYPSQVNGRAGLLAVLRAPAKGARDLDGGRSARLYQKPAATMNPHNGPYASQSTLNLPQPLSGPQGPSMPQALASHKQLMAPPQTLLQQQQHNLAHPMTLQPAHAMPHARQQQRMVLSQAVQQQGLGPQIMAHPQGMQRQHSLPHPHAQQQGLPSLQAPQRPALSHQTAHHHQALQQPGPTQDLMHVTDGVPLPGLRHSHGPPGPQPQVAGVVPPDDNGTNSLQQPVVYGPHRKPPDADAPPNITVSTSTIPLSMAAGQHLQRSGDLSSIVHQINRFCQARAGMGSTSVCEGQIANPSPISRNLSNCSIFSISWSNRDTTSTLPNIPRSTLPNTPRSTLPNTPRSTLPNTPRSTLPNTPRSTLPNTPRSTLPNTPRSTLPNTPRSTLPNTPRSTLPNTPRSTPPNTPRSTPPNTPRSTPRSTPPNTPRSTPPNTPRSTPPNTPRSTPPNTPRSSPPNTPRSTPPNTPRSTPPNTPRSSPPNTPRSSPPNTPRSTPPNTPRSTPPNTPRSTPPNSPPNTPRSSPPNTPRSSPPNTPRSSPPNTPRSTLPNTPRSSPPNTPRSTTCSKLATRRSSLTNNRCILTNIPHSPSSSTYSSCAGRSTSWPTCSSPTRVSTLSAAHSFPLKHPPETPRSSSPVGGPAASVRYTDGCYMQSPWTGIPATGSGPQELPVPYQGLPTGGGSPGAKYRPGTAGPTGQSKPMQGVDFLTGGLQMPGYREQGLDLAEKMQRQPLPTLGQVQEPSNDRGVHGHLAGYR